MAKIRTDFITNSSSSSYIIAFNKLESDKSYRILRTIIQTDFDYEEDYCKITSVRKLDEYFLEEKCWGDYDTIEKLLEHDNYAKEEYDFIKSLLKDYKTVYKKEVSYRNDLFKDLIEVVSEDEIIYVKEER